MVGILIVEDLIAILLMAGLTAIASGSGLSASSLLATTGRLGAFLAVLLVVGLLVVPRTVRGIVKLKRDEIGRIVEIQLGRLRKRLADRDMSIELTTDAEQQIASEGWDPAFGARPLKRTIQQRIENALASRILGGEFGPGDHILCDFKRGSFVFVRREQAPKAT